MKCKIDDDAIAVTTSAPPVESPTVLDQHSARVVRPSWIECHVAVSRIDVMPSSSSGDSLPGYLRRALLPG